MIKTVTELKDSLRRADVLRSRQAPDTYTIQHSILDESLKSLIEANKSELEELENEISLFMAAKRGELPSRLNKLSDLGRFLIAARIARGLSQSDLARLMNVSKVQVGRDEKHNYRSISIERAERILEALGVAIDLTLPQSKVTETAKLIEGTETEPDVDSELEPELDPEIEEDKSQNSLTALPTIEEQTTDEQESSLVLPTLQEAVPRKSNTLISLMVESPAGMVMEAKNPEKVCKNIEAQVLSQFKYERASWSSKLWKASATYQAEINYSDTQHLQGILEDLQQKCRLHAEKLKCTLKIQFNSKEL